MTMHQVGGTKDFADARPDSAWAVCLRCGQSFGRTARWRYYVYINGGKRYFCTYGCSRAWDKAHGVRRGGRLDGAYEY